MKSEVEFSDFQKDYEMCNNSFFWILRHLITGDAKLLVKRVQDETGKPDGFWRFIG